MKKLRNIVFYPNNEAHRRAILSRRKELDVPCFSHDESTLISNIDAIINRMDDYRRDSNDIAVVIDNDGDLRIPGMTSGAFINADLETMTLEDLYEIENRTNEVPIMDMEAGQFMLLLFDNLVYIAMKTSAYTNDILVDLSEGTEDSTFRKTFWSKQVAIPITRSQLATAIVMNNEQLINYYNELK